MIKTEITEFLKRLAALGYTLDELLEKLQNLKEVQYADGTHK